MSRSRPTEQWWTGAVGYEVYVRSFADGNDDGVGDLPGITARLDHLRWLGIDAVWLTPFFPSPGHDHGYDVADYCGVDPQHGDLEDFDALVTEAHRLDLRVIVDIVPNHTSSEHPWFLASRTSRDDPMRGWYLWRDPAPDGGPPNNWVSHFGGPAWTLDPGSGQYYCHLFLPEQPDLDWTNPGVLEAFDEILRFWCERGVDGFRIDVAHGIAKDPQLRDNPQLRTITPDMGPRAVFDSYAHLHDLDQDANIDVFRRWNRVVDPYGAVLIGEVNQPDPRRLARYVQGDALHTAFFLQPVWMDWQPAELCAAVAAAASVSPTGISWVTDNHDTGRSVSRFGGGDRGRARSLALVTLMFGLGGMPFLYQGQELALPDGELYTDGVHDPLTTRNPGTSDGRDVARTPMPWDEGPTNGFSPRGRSWIHAVDRPRQLTVAHQRADPASSLAVYRDLIALRHRLPELRDAPLEWVPTDSPTTLAARRGAALVVANLGPVSAEVGSDVLEPHVEFATAAGAVTRTADGLEIAAESTAIIRPA